MKNLKKILLGGVSLAGVVVFVLSFFAKVRTVNGSIETVYKNVIWGSQVTPSIKTGPAVLSMIGVLVVLLAALAICCVALVGEKILKEEKTRKTVVITAGALMVLGGIFLLLTKQAFASALAEKAGMSAHDILEMWSHFKVKTTVSLVAGIGAIVAGLGAVGVTLFVKEK